MTDNTLAWLAIAISAFAIGVSVAAWIGRPR